MRTTIQALAAVLGGTQSLHTNSMDEALALPSEKAARLALRTQQVIAHESGAVNTVDPLGGSFFVETLTDQMEEECYDYFRQIEALGGVIPAIEAGFLQREIADSAYRYQREIDTKERIIVGVNDYVMDEPLGIPILEMDPEGERREYQRLARLRSERDNDRATRSLAALRDACGGKENLMPHILEAVNAYCTLGEICGVMRQVVRGVPGAVDHLGTRGFAPTPASPPERAAIRAPGEWPPTTPSSEDRPLHRRLGLRGRSGRSGWRSGRRWRQGWRAVDCAAGTMAKAVYRGRSTARRRKPSGSTRAGRAPTGQSALPPSRRSMKRTVAPASRSRP